MVEWGVKGCRWIALFGLSAPKISRARATCILFGLFFFMAGASFVPWLPSTPPDGGRLHPSAGRGRDENEHAPRRFRRGHIGSGAVCNRRPTSCTLSPAHGPRRGGRYASMVVWQKLSHSSWSWSRGISLWQTALWKMMPERMWTKVSTRVTVLSAWRISPHALARLMTSDQ